MNHHGNKKERLDSLSNSSWNGYTVGRPPLHQHLLASSSLDWKCQWCPVQLLVSKVAPFGTGVDTHTVPLGGARVRNLNRYLKSLRNKRKKDRKRILSP